MMKSILLAAALALAIPAQAQSAGTPAKKELVARILKAQEPAVEALARTLVEAPAAQLLQRAGQYIQARVPADKREATAREVQAEARKYIDETVPLVREKALKLAPTTIGVMLDERLTEDELREILKIFESPTWRKFQGMALDMQKALGEKLVAESKDHVEPRVRALDQAMAKRLGLPPAASAPGTGK